MNTIKIACIAIQLHKQYSPLLESMGYPYEATANIAARIARDFTKEFDYINWDRLTINLENPIHKEVLYKQMCRTEDEAMKAYGQIRIDQILLFSGMRNLN